jgi:hypothetical protein
MNIAINQPYLFPHVKYFQLIHQSHLFIIYDDVQYIKKGWINKNRLNNNTDEKKLTIPIKKQSQSTLIKDTLISQSHFQEFIKNTVVSINKMYKNSEEKDFIIELLKESLLLDSEYLDNYLIFYLKEITQFLNIEFNYKRSSTFDSLKTSKPDKKIISIIEHLGGSVYINLDSGRSLYKKDIFLKNKIDLNFISDLYPNNQVLDKNYSIISHLLLEGQEITSSYIH